MHRDLLKNGFRADDLFNADRPNGMCLEEVISYVCGAETTSAIWEVVNECWTKEAQLLANLSEQWGQQIEVRGRYRRPGVTQRDIDAVRAAATPGVQAVPFDALDEDRFERMQAKRYRDGGCDNERVAELLGVSVERVTELLGA